MTAKPVKNLLLGMKWGLAMGVALSTWALLVAGLVVLAGGSFMLGGRYATYHPFAVVGGYLIGGILAGAILGAARPLLRSPVAAALIGVVATVPFGIVALITREEFTSWQSAETWVLVAFSVLMGGPGGLIVRAFIPDARPSRRRQSR